jgi:hypothetical protein
VTHLLAAARQRCPGQRRREDGRVLVRPMLLRVQQRPPAAPPPYRDEKVANREIRIWHLVVENGYWMMDKSKTPRHPS